MMLRFPISLLAAALLVGCGLADEPAATPELVAAEATPAAVAAPAEAGAEGMDDHCAKMGHSSPFERSEVTYEVPAIELTDQTGQAVNVAELASSERPVVLNFIFATCTTICPVMTSTFAQTRAQLGAEADKVRMVSITIDPEHDTPEVLAAYAEKYEAPSDWQFLTGEGTQVNQVLRSFDAHFGSKFGHEPITLLHKPGSDTWTRLEGLGSGTALAKEVRELLAPVIQ